MIKYTKMFLLLISGMLILSCNTKNEIERKPYKEEINEKINRGLVCFTKDIGYNFLSWRKLTTDETDQKYFIWRKNSVSEVETINIAITNSTFFIDSSKTNNKVLYGISTLKDEKPTKYEEVIIRDTNNYDALKFDLQVNYQQAYVVTGDLTGDGELEVLINYSEMDRVDPFEKAGKNRHTPFIWQHLKKMVVKFGKLIEEWE